MCSVEMTSSVDDLLNSLLDYSRVWRINFADTDVDRKPQGRRDRCANLDRVMSDG